VNSKLNGPVTVARKFLFFILWILSIPFVSSANAQEPAQDFSLRPWAVGQSSTYQTSIFGDDGQLLNAVTITYSIVDKEAVNGKDYLWLEIERDEPGGVTIINKIQIRQPKGLYFKGVLTMDLDNGLIGKNSPLAPRRLIRKISFGNDKRHSSTCEFELSREAVDHAENRETLSGNKDSSGPMTVVPEPSVQVGAGSFTALKFHVLNPGNGPALMMTPGPSADNKSASQSVSPSSLASAQQTSDVWGSADIPIWGVIKKNSGISGKDKTILARQTELLSYAETGATSKIKGKPYLLTLEKRKKISDEMSRKNPKWLQVPGTNQP
jgi:hypothetical protein